MREALGHHAALVGHIDLDLPPGHSRLDADRPGRVLGGVLQQVDEHLAQQRGLDRSVRIRAQAMTTDTASTFQSGDMRKVVGYDMAAAAAGGVRGCRFSGGRLDDFVRSLLV